MKHGIMLSIHQTCHDFIGNLAEGSKFQGREKLRFSSVHKHRDFFYSQVVDFRKKNITYYDSMGGINNEACRILM